jgi:AcrR family transcriptional regulator
MENTKEKILLAALRLFSIDGYEAVSMRTIAEQLGITKGALYKHYESKQEIFDSIVQRMKEKDAKQADAFSVPSGTFKETPEASRGVLFQKIKTFSVRMFRYWTEDEFACDFRRMLTLEQYRNPAMAELLHRYLTGGVIGYAKDLIREASADTASRDKDPEILALEYFAPIYMMMSLYDGMSGKDEAVRMVERHIDYYIESMEERK